MQMSDLIPIAVDYLVTRHTVQETFVFQTTVRLLWTDCADMPIASV